MKKYNRLIIISCVIYIVAALLGAVVVYNNQNIIDKKYRVEINRITAAMSGDYPNTEIDTDIFSYVYKAEFISVNEEPEKIHKFFTYSGRENCDVLPWYNSNTLTGYLRFFYHTDNSYQTAALFVLEASLFVFELFVLIILLNIRKKIIIPFSTINTVSEELAKGHIYNIEEERKDYFKSFTRSIGKLKDTIAISKKRELALLKEKKVLLLSISHDIKTPLNAIKLYSKALHDDIYETDSERKEACVHISEKTETIESYVEKIMETARENIFDIAVEKNDFYLKELIDKVCDTYKSRCEMRTTKLIIDSYEDHIINGDLDRLFEVLENIFENAFKYGDGRRIEVSFREEEYRQLISVFNTGEIVSDNDINHIFDSFFRGANSKRQQGNGLGLYICREIMNKMGGEIYAERKEEGMEFTIVI